MSYTYALAERGKTLATRPLGAQLREELLREATNADEVVLDFNGVLGTSHSFADEFVAQLAEEVRDGTFDFDLVLCGPSPGVESIVQKALDRRGLNVSVLV